MVIIIFYLLHKFKIQILFAKKKKIGLRDLYIFCIGQTMYLPPLKIQSET